MSGHPLDLGCGWLHSADENEWAEVAAKLGFSIDQTPPPWARRTDAIGFPAAHAGEFRAALERFYARLAGVGEVAPDRAAAELLEPDSRWNPLLNALSTYINGVELDRLSARDFARYHDTGRQLARRARLRRADRRLRGRPRRHARLSGNAGRSHGPARARRDAARRDRGPRRDRHRAHRYPCLGCPVLPPRAAGQSRRGRGAAARIGEQAVPARGRGGRSAARTARVSARSTAPQPAATTCGRSAGR